MYVAINNLYRPVCATVSWRLLSPLLPVNSTYSPGVYWVCQDSWNKVIVHLQCILLMRMSKMWPSSRIINNSQHYTLQALTSTLLPRLYYLSATRVGVAAPSCCHQKNWILFHLLLLQHCLYWQLLALLLGVFLGIRLDAAPPTGIPKLTLFQWEATLNAAQPSAVSA